MELLSVPIIIILGAFIVNSYLEICSIHKTLKNIEKRLFGGNNGQKTG